MLSHKKNGIFSRLDIKLSFVLYNTRMKTVPRKGGGPSLVELASRYLPLEVFERLAFLLSLFSS